MKALIFSLMLMAGAAPALAEAPLGAVSFAEGVATPEKVVVNDRLWRCAGESCSGPGETRGVAMMRACKSLARDVGPIATFKVGVAALEADAIAQCNGVAKD